MRLDQGFTLGQFNRGRAIAVYDALIAPRRSSTRPSRLGGQLNRPGVAIAIYDALIARFEDATSRPARTKKRRGSWLHAPFVSNTETV